MVRLDVFALEDPVADEVAALDEAADSEADDGSASDEAWVDVLV
jgi:hypothetical protein